MKRYNIHIAPVAIALIFKLGCAPTIAVTRLAPGITYTKVRSDFGGFIHIATVDLKHATLKLVQAQNPALKTVSQMAKEHQAIVAVNGSFFSAEGKPVGAVKIDGIWKSFPQKNRGVFGFSNNGDMFFDRVLLQNGKIVAELSQKPWWDFTDNIIGGAPLVISHGIILDVASEQTLESFLKGSYARTAVCIDEQELLRLVVLDGGDRRTAGFGGGMTIGQLALFLKSLGCRNALNLDGGYSSSFVVDGKRKNHFNVRILPERKVATALVITARHKNQTSTEPTHHVKYLELETYETSSNNLVLTHVINIQ
jgi:exopolysaccharide biosynthesis protein